MYFEFYAVGHPPSVNKASAIKKDSWKAIVRAECAATIASGTQTLMPLPYPKSSIVKVYFFPTTKQYFDLDNGLKYTLDGINQFTAGNDAKRLGLVPTPHTLITDDRNVARIVAERVVLKPGASIVARIGAVQMFLNAYAAALAAAVPGAPKPYGVAIKVEPFIKRHGPKW
ncbi:hypothetical protein [Herbaspirillum rubrisubalbicans]|uniref:hypothetical protein n=1 Tax=Herbaspirillum rubrisubalbicans TaxID=80842 RepID=UPI0012E399BC|nr:hypothetical protein [Herbaspirillum rubrisubalbicans]